jgi:hypothetical protein
MIVLDTNVISHLTSPAGDRSPVALAWLGRQPAVATRTVADFGPEGSS